MTPALGLIEAVESRGVMLWAVDGNLRFLATAGRLPPDLRETLSSHKEDLLMVLAQRAKTPAPPSWPEEWRDLYEERAAIREYDGGLPRHEAELLAAKDVLAKVPIT